MIFTGTLNLADNTSIRFYPNGEILRTVKGKMERISRDEMVMHLRNASSYTYGSPTFHIDGKLVTYAAFKAEIEKIEITPPHIKDEDYVEQYIEHTPYIPDNAPVEVIDPEATIVTKVEPKVNTKDDEDDLPAVVVDPEDVEAWWS